MLLKFYQKKPLLQVCGIKNWNSRNHSVQEISKEVFNFLFASDARFSWVMQVAL